mgnify:CR=1 FL=1
MSEVYVMVTICSRKNMPRFVDCYKDYNVEAANISLGRGTASSDCLLYTSPSPRDLIMLKQLIYR